MVLSLQKNNTAGNVSLAIGKYLFMESWVNLNIEKAGHAILALFLVLSLTSAGQNYDEFSGMLSECGINFSIPPNTIECAIIENDDMNYEYALKLKDKDFEVRYAIRPIATGNTRMTRSGKKWKA
jgi:hypothetical protein